MAYSDRCGGTLTLPSPTHVHHVDMSAAVRSLRRSLSRSPSKFNLRSPEASVADAGPGTTTTTPPSPGRSRAGSTHTTRPPSPHRFANFTAQPNLLSTPSRSGVKLSVRSARPRSTAKTFSRTRASPQSPLQRVFGAALDTTLNIPSAVVSGQESQGSENSFINFALNLGESVSRRTLEKPSRHSLHLDVSGSSKLNMTKIPGINDTFANFASPLKRNDATMNTDRTSAGSPVAKRRSLHGIGNLPEGADFDMMTTPSADNYASTPGGSESDDSETKLSLMINARVNSPASRAAQVSPTPTPPLPKRTASLRRSTLEQRPNHQRPSNSGPFGRHAGERQAARMLGAEPTTPSYRSRPRLSVESWAPLPDDRGSPFAAPSTLPNASMHPMPNIQNTQQTVQPHQPHPLSRSVTQSSSNSSIESPTQVPQPSFSRSMPPLGPRPVSRGQGMATPVYRQIQTQHGAFMSTGLISKMNRKPENVLDTPRMPDTPCKKSSNNYATFPPPSSSGGRRPPVRTPINGPVTPMAPLSLRTRGSPLFGPVRQAHGNGLYGDEGDGLNGDDSEDRPSTPCKTLFRDKVPGKIPASTPMTSRVEAASMFGYQVSSAKGNTSPMVSPGQSQTSSPKGAMLPPQPSRIPIPKREVFKVDHTTVPATPTTNDREDAAVLASGRVTPQNLYRPKDVDECLMAAFGKAAVIGKGEFSSVYRVQEEVYSTDSSSSSPLFGSSTSSSKVQVFAVKRIKLPLGIKAREAKYREVNIMRALVGRNEVVQYRDHWDADGFLYIKMDFYEEGTLDKFLHLVGHKGRMDDFRIWKILIDLSQGLQAIHDAGFIHLDLKPANVMVDFQGYLKIGDFGMASTWPVPKYLDGEGDREYIGPEILQGRFDKPADIFALGMILFEASVNSLLPDNGPMWQALRNNGLADLALLTSVGTHSVTRDAHGIPIDTEANAGPSSFEEALSKSVAFGGRRASAVEGNRTTHDASNLFGNPSRDHLQQAPVFMKDQYHYESLDNVARRMLNSNPDLRPTAKELLELGSVRWVLGRRNAGATVFEGNFGPRVDESGDTEMTDV